MHKFSVVLSSKKCVVLKDEKRMQKFLKRGFLDLRFFHLTPAYAMSSRGLLCKICRIAEMPSFIFSAKPFEFCIFRNQVLQIWNAPQYELAFFNSLNIEIEDYMCFRNERGNGNMNLFENQYHLFVMHFSRCTNQNKLKLFFTFAAYFRFLTN